MRPKLTREEIERRLRELAEKPAAEPMIAAMCYSGGPPPAGNWVFVCPECGRRTAYIVNTCSPRRPAGLPPDVAAVRFVTPFRVSMWCPDIAGLFPPDAVVRIDDSVLCASCYPENENGRADLVIRLPYEAEERRVRLEDDDLDILAAFFQGRDQYESSGMVYPLQCYVERLRRVLLGESSPPSDA